MPQAQSIETDPEPVPPEAIYSQLARITTSTSFRQSKRLSRFLRFVVERTVANDIQDLKERTVGVEVFERAPNYDLAADPIVRISAGEIRKRLAQYYVVSEHSAELRIELPPGSYIPSFPGRTTSNMNLTLPKTVPQS